MIRTNEDQANPLLRVSLGMQTGPAKTLLLRLPGIPLQRIVIGISARQLLGIQPAEAFAPWPADPPRWMGVVEWSGRQVQVVDLAACLGLGASDYRMARRLAFLRCPRNPGVVAVPAMGEMIQLENTDDARPAALERGLAGEFVRGIFHLGSELLLIPDLDAIWERVLHPARDGTRRV